ncbi:MAG: hypothetical protein HY791_37770 [Deltaproteobacteria bacterium]|nr:hypothetical protein [Deltaproteobacteria bacterium]
MTSWLRPLVLGPAFGVLGCTAATTPPNTVPVAHMAESTYLTEEIREVVRSSMSTHGKEVQPLLWSTLFLDLDWTAKHAAAIANGPRLHRDEDPKVPKDERMPERLVKLDAELAEAARGLEKLAAAKEPITPAQLAEAFGETVKVCVRCHATYLFPGEHIERAKER